MSLTPTGALYGSGGLALSFRLHQDNPYPELLCLLCFRLHPRHKEEIAWRLFLAACQEAYGITTHGAYKGPQVTSITRGNNARVRVEYDRDIVCLANTGAVTWQVRVGLHSASRPQITLTTGTTCVPLLQACCDNNGVIESNDCDYESRWNDVTNLQCGQDHVEFTNPCTIQDRTRQFR